MSLNKPPPRLFVARASGSNTAVVLRRGPSSSTGIYRWNLANDTFVEGQWFYGRIYDHRVDISPDGEFWSYFALSTKGAAFTAIARPPFLKALDFYAENSTWGGGAPFVDERTYWIGSPPVESRGDRKHSTLRLADELAPLEDIGPGISPCERRLLAQGWQLVEFDDSAPAKRRTFSRTLSGEFVLSKTLLNALAADRTIEHEENALVRTRDGALVREGLEWADTDGDDMVFAVDGALYRGDPTDLDSARQLKDFSADSHRDIEAPY